MVNYESFYPGSYSSLEPEYGELFTGYKIPVRELGASTSVQTANQLKEVANLLNQGMIAVEVSALQPEIIEMIPKQNLKEINRLTKLTGAETTLHGPVTDASGFNQQGRWTKEDRELAERQFTEVIERANDLNPDGNIPVTFHASMVQGTEFIPFDAVEGLTEEEKERWKEYGGVPQQMVAVDQETGQLIPLVREKRFYPEEVKGKIYRPEEELKIANKSYWDQKLSQLVFYKQRADELISQNEPLVRRYLKDIQEGRLNPEALTPTQQKAINIIKNSQLFLENSYLNLRELFNQAYKFSDETGKNKLKNVSEGFQQQIGEFKKTGDPIYFSNAVQSLINEMQEITYKYTPQIYKPVDEFAKEQASETFTNVAYNAYKKFKDKAPIVSIENPPYGWALGNAEDLKELVDEARKKFVEKAKKDGVPESKARQIAEKLIGVTWDTSHISMMRKKGYKPEALVKEAKKIAPYVKHVHLNDNFGTTHTDLPPGMGSVPIKEILKELEKAGYKGKKIFEGGGFFQHFQMSPHPYVLEAFGHFSAPYGAYFGGYGTILPEQHFSMYGGGWSSLPQELGGQIPGKQSRMSGAPLQ